MFESIFELQIPLLGWPSHELGFLETRSVSGSGKCRCSFQRCAGSFFTEQDTREKAAARLAALPDETNVRANDQALGEGTAQFIFNFGT